MEALLKTCEITCSLDPIVSILVVSTEFPYAIRFSGNDSAFEIAVDAPGAHLFGFNGRPRPRLRRACLAAGLEIFR